MVEQIKGEGNSTNFLPLALGLPCLSDIAIVLLKAIEKITGTKNQSGVYCAVTSALEISLEHSGSGACLIAIRPLDCASQIVLTQFFDAPQLYQLYENSFDDTSSIKELQQFIEQTNFSTHRVIIVSFPITTANEASAFERVSVQDLQECLSKLQGRQASTNGT